MERKEKFKKNNLLPVILVAIIFGLGAGVVGELFSRSYFFGDIYNVPLFGSINLPNNYDGSSVIISGARKVVVEQDLKAAETINTASNSLFGIYKAKLGGESEAVSFAGQSYNASEAIGQGIILTSDGWVAAGYLPAGLDSGSLDKYRLINGNKEVYEIEKIVKDEASGIFFIRAKGARDLPVRRFAQKSDLDPGQSLVGIAHSGRVFGGALSFCGDGGYIKSSDRISTIILLDRDIKKEYVGSMIVNLSGDIVGLVGQDLNIKPVFNLEPALKSLMKEGEISAPVLGVNYVGLHGLIGLSGGYYNGDKGAIVVADRNGLAVVPGSAAYKAGLRAGDIILSIDNVDVTKSNDLSDLVSHYSKGDKVSLKYLGEEGERVIEIEL